MSGELTPLQEEAAGEEERERRRPVFSSGAQVDHRPPYQDEDGQGYWRKEWSWRASGGEQRQASQEWSPQVWRSWYGYAWDDAGDDAGYLKAAEAHA